MIPGCGTGLVSVVIEVCAIFPSIQSPEIQRMDPAPRLAKLLERTEVGGCPFMDCFSPFPAKAPPLKNNALGMALEFRMLSSEL